MRILPVLAALGVSAAPAVVHAAPCVVAGGDLIVSNTCQLSGELTVDEVHVTSTGRIEVNPYTGGDKRLTGNLQLRARTITIDAGGVITARGSGYLTPLCGDGVQPGAGDAAGGCAVRDSGGGGAHFGAGGRGTKDCATTGCTFPLHWEEDCGNSLNGMGTACSTQSDCRNNDALPTTASVSYFHNIYDPEFGGSGGDKGCRDNDGFGLNTSGRGGGRIVLAGVVAEGTVSIAGQVIADGKRGCGFENDSGGGGAGGTVLIAGNAVTIAATARITAAGGLGGDTRGSLDPTGDCAGAQQGSTCDDCGGGGGGGIISVLSVTSTISDPAVFSVGGALGGTCAICQGEAGGGAGELQLAGAYLGEFCDGFDNDFDGMSDEDLPMLACPSGMMPSCVGGVPQSCPPDLPACVAPVTDTRARFVVIVDTSGSMLTGLDGDPTLGDGSVDHPGFDQDGDGLADDSRLFLAKRALSTVIAAYPEIDFALARYHQDTAEDRSCQLAHWFECADLCCSYDDPRNNAVPAPVPACSIDGGAAGMVSVLTTSPGDECINYAGNCGPPRRGADVLVDFGSDINQHLMWLDGTETNYDETTTVGDFCDFAGGGDCELRGTGPTPLDNSLRAVTDFLAPIIPCDAAESGGCRTYGVILLTDGAESCNGDPVDAAADLRTSLDVETFVVGFSVLPTEAAQMNAIANAGSFSGTRPAFLVGSEDALANALATIVSDSVVFETCNDADDDCDTRVDEDFPALGNPCNDGELGDCLGTGTLVCNGTGDGVSCMITDPGEMPGTEVCNGGDDDCDGLIDEGLGCQTPCTPTGPDVCNGLDDDCNGAVDDADPMVGDDCGDTEEGVCELGTFVCIAGDLVCVGVVLPEPMETCDGQDDDCDMLVDEDAECPGKTACVEGGCRLPCGSGEFECPLGFECIEAQGGDYCIPGPCATCEQGEICQNDMCVDPCEGVTCEAGEQCVLGDCLDCTSLGCDAGEVCFDHDCVPDPCLDVDCADAAGCDGELGCSCVGGDCVPNCDDTLCPDGQLCNDAGQCEPDACADVVCAGTLVCVDGECVVDPCDDELCPPGEACANGECIVDPCPNTECSAGRHCEVSDDGEPVCVADEPRPPPDRVFAGGGGCAAGGGGGGGGGALALLGLALARLARRRRA